MRRPALIALMGTSLMLGGCAASPIGGLLGNVLGGGNDYNDRNLSQFERAAVNACGREAEKYGDVRITDVRQASNDIVEVRGDTRSRNGTRNFACAFRSDGRIIDFRI